MATNWDEPDARAGRGVVASWGAVFRDVKSLAMDLTIAGTEMARQVPTVPAILPPSTLPRSIDEFTRGLSRVEDAVLREIKTRLDAVDPGPGRHRSGASFPRTPAQLLDDLLAASIDADSATSRDELYRSLLGQLVPDEARILAALADGDAHPLVHVQNRADGGYTVLANASTVGRAAGVQVPEAASIYVTHLRSLGLAEEGPADDSLSVQYDILLGEPVVREAAEEARRIGRLSAKVVRRTLRLSALGRDLWQACRPDSVAPAERTALEPAGRDDPRPALELSPTAPHRNGDGPH